MDIRTVLFIILAAIISLALVLFQYYYKSKKRGKLGLLLSFLRFLAWFGAFLLLINPKFTKNEYALEKANLMVLIDNSTSVKESSSTTLIEDFKETAELREKFNLHFHTFGDGLNTSDSLTFSEKNTNIAKALKTARTIYGRNNGAIVLLTDGNQTIGEDYEFSGKNNETPIFPLVVGDTTRYEDLRIDQVNVNKYAFLKNKFPLEAYISYEGEGNISSSVAISVNGKIVYREKISFSNTVNTKVLNTVLDANSIGIKNIEVSVAILENEKNRINNQRKIAIEVIDEKTEVAIISGMVHPDIGTLKKAIESNEQRLVSIKRPTVSLEELVGVNLLILYQPDPSFRAVYNYLQKKKINSFTIVGPQTDTGFLNSIQQSFVQQNYDQTEEVFPDLNAAFGIFNISDFSVSDFPPLESNLGEIVIQKPHEVLLGQRIKGANLNQPLLAILGTDREREALLFGENLWKWRVQSYRNDQDFNNFDDFIGKLVLYLADTKPKSRFTADYQSVYEGSNGAKITATYFDETFIFDANATIDLQLKNSETGKTTGFPMLLKSGYYEADLSDIPAGTYNFTAKVMGENLSKSGSFSILDFDVEAQFLSSDHAKLSRLAEATFGKNYFPSQMDTLIKDLLADDRFKSTQKSEQNVVSLIDFRILLAIIVAALAMEWFVRKYNGLT